MPDIIIDGFDPSSRQIYMAAVEVARHPESKLVVKSMPEEGAKVFGDAEWTGRRKKDYERGLGYIHEFAGRMNLKNQVFLGGACGVPWRAEAIKTLEDAGCQYYNPEVADFEIRDAELKAGGLKGGIMELEAIHKTSSYVLLFVFDPSTRAIATVNECIEFMTSGKQEMVVVKAYVEAGTVIGGQVVTEEEADDINEARDTLFEHLEVMDVHIVDSVEEAIAIVVGLMQEAADGVTI
jgi:hypothetical protein